MNYQILYQDAFPVVKCDLAQGESIKAESDAMVAMSGTLDVNGSMGGNLISGIARRVLAGESFFFQNIVASRGLGYVLLGHPIPGGIIDVDLDGSYNLRVQKDGFLAATQGIQVDTAIQNLAQGIFSREGFFVVNARGRGTVFLSSYGAIHAINLDPGEEAIVDNGHLVAWPDYMNYRIEKASNGWISSIMSGECLVCRFRGPGTVLIQTRNPASFTQWIKKMTGSNN
ncbi:MAG: TIGR00266 family protein [Hungatella sp.]|nr:TIGR00266 family protein [Hungatella sp.]MCI9502025.1 TIGR00266 family protein [Hungatella sp.]